MLYFLFVYYRLDARFGEQEETDNECCISCLCITDWMLGLVSRKRPIKNVVFPVCVLQIGCSVW